jgi:hypothetical protein
MGQTGLGCRDATPLRIKPDLGQVSENSSKPCTKEAWHIFQHEDAGTYFSGQPFDVPP